MTMRWRPTPFVMASMLWHVVAAVLLVWDLMAHRGWWPWLLAGVVLNHLLIMAQGLWPRSTWLGANLRRLPDPAAQRREVAITIDDGPDPQVTPQVLRVLARHGAKATFFCIGELAQRHPELCRQIVAAGHEIGNHGQRHRLDSALMGPAGWRQEVGDGLATLAQITGQRPRFYRAVAGLRNPVLDPVLHQLGLQLASWTRRGFDTRCGDADIVLKRLNKGLAAGDILLLHDGHAAPTPDGQPVILAVLPRLLDALNERRLKTVTLSEACNPP
jgi:peptidoglycan/xylan/chitin deacetylase (PgdA/CDA1 family)